MPPRPSRNNIRNVESGDIESRPRDAALRKSANERAVAFIRQVETERSENQVTAYPTVSQDFDQYASERTIQPTINSSPARNANIEYRSGVSMNQTRSVKTQVAPSSKQGGKPLRKPGLKRAIPNVPVLDVSPVKLVRATTVSVSNITWGLGLWASIQFPIAVISIILFGLTYVVYDVIPDMIRGATGEVIYRGLSFIYNTASEAVIWLLDKIFGFNLAELANPANYFMLAHMLVFVIGIATLILMGIIYQISLINCVFGKHAALKICTLLFATFAYMVPLLNLLPWFIFWVLVVWRYPE